MTHTATVYTEARDGSDRFYLGTLGPVRNLHWSSTYPGGAAVCEFDLFAEPDRTHRALAKGRKLAVRIGAEYAWRGFLARPTPGDPWHFTGVGLAAVGDEWVSWVANPLNPLNTNIDGAITRGLPWLRSQSLPNFTTTTGTAQRGMTIADAITQVSQALYQPWQVDSRDGYVTMGAPPAASTYYLNVGGTMGGPTDDGFASALYAAYTDSTTHAVGYRGPIVDAAAEARVGRIEHFVDMSGVGEESAANVDAALTNALNSRSNLLRWAGSVDVIYGRLTNTGGQPVDLATVVAGKRVTVFDIAPDPSGRQVTGNPTFVIGEADYSDETGVLTLTAMDSVRTDLIERLALS